MYVNNVAVFQYSYFQSSGPLTSTPRKPSTPYQLWREEHMKQELGVHRSVLGNIDSLPSNTAKIMDTTTRSQSPEEDPDQTRRMSETPTKKYPPTRLYIEEEPGKKVETFVRWKQSQNERELQKVVDSDAVSDTRHLSELEKQIEMVQKSERESTVSPAADDRDHAISTPKSKKKDKKGSISSLLNVFTRKKTTSNASATPPVKKKKSSLTVMMEKEASGSVLDPSAQQKIIEKEESERTKSPYQLWRSYREKSQDKGDSVSHLQSEGDIIRHSIPPMSLRTPTPDPDYDNLSFKSNSPRAPRESPRAPRDHPSFDDNSSDTSFEDYGRYTPRSTASEYGRNIPRYQPMPNLITGYARGISPANSETGVNVNFAGAKRSPSTDSFFGKNGASVGQSSSSQIWYQKYKHSSFSHPNQNSFGEHLYGAFDGRISKFRGKQSQPPPALWHLLGTG